MSTETKHTPEPWAVGKTPTVGVDRVYSEAYGAGGHVCSDVKSYDARRIVACVNACKGMSTETLELAANGAPDVKEWFQGWGEQDTLEAQRDELAAALRDVLRDRLTQTNLHQMPPAMRARLEKARAALAKVQP